MTMVGFPLLLIPVAIYNMIAFLMPGVSLTEQTEPLFKVALMSGSEWPVTLRDILLTLGIVMLLFEVIKGARPGAKFLTDHLLSLIVFGCAAAEFVLWPRFGTSTYFLLTLLTLVDFLSGIALRARRGMVVAGTTTVARKRGRNVEAPVAEPEIEAARDEVTPVPVPEAAPVPAPITMVPSSASAASVPPATSVAESVLLDRPDPSFEPHPTAPDTHVPETPAAELHSTELPPHETPAAEVLPPEPGHEPHAVHGDSHADHPAPLSSEPDPKR
jgi:hypothetical protein